MVRPRLPWLVLVAAMAGVAAAGPPPDATTGARGPVRSALSKGNYPWYDSKADAVKPLWPPREWNLDWLDRWLRPVDGKFGSRPGQWIVIALVVLGFSILLGVLVQLWRIYRPTASDVLATARGPGSASRVEGLPEGLRPETNDPWSEAVRCRARGDYRRAVICLFAHQLLTLDRLRQVRLVPGRTGRQLVRAIGDAQLRSWVDPTLRLFESVYYGQNSPTAEAFEPVWAAAEAFQRRVAEGGGVVIGEGVGRRRVSAHAVAWLGLVLLAMPGCFSTQAETTYGRQRGKSLNGTGALADLLRGEGHEVRSAIRLTEELNHWADVIVRFAPRPGPPSREEADWYEDWLSNDSGRRLIYVPRDYDARADYWGQVLEGLARVEDAPVDQKARARKLRDEARQWYSHLPDPAKDPATADDWFAVEPPKPDQVKACKSLGGPWSVGIDPAKAALPRHDTLKVGPETVLLTGDDKPLAIEWTSPNEGRVLVLANGSFLLNAALVNEARRRLASRAVAWAVGEGESRRVAFVEGAYVVGEEPGMPSVFQLLRVWPFGWVSAQMLALGLAACLARAPRLGRARPEPPSGEDRPAAHPEALGALLARTGQDDVARAQLDAYQQWRRKSAAGPTPGPG